MALRCVPLLVPDPLYRPAVFPAPVAGDFFQCRIGRIIIANIDRKTRLLENARVLAFQPVIEPAYRFMTPFDSRLGPCIVRKIVVPGPDHRFDRCTRVFQHARQAVAITVIPATDMKTRHTNFIVLPAGGSTVPERPVALLVHVGIDARLHIEAIFDPVVVHDEIRRAG